MKLIRSIHEIKLTTDTLRILIKLLDQSSLNVKMGKMKFKKTWNMDKFWSILTIYLVEGFYFLKRASYSSCSMTWILQRRLISVISAAIHAVYIANMVKIRSIPAWSAICRKNAVILLFHRQRVMEKLTAFVNTIIEQGILSKWTEKCPIFMFFGISFFTSDLIGLYLTFFLRIVFWYLKAWFS